MTLEQMISEVVDQAQERELLIGEVYLPSKEDIDQWASLAPTEYIAVKSVEANELAMDQIKRAKSCIKNADIECNKIKDPLNEAKSRLINLFDRIKAPMLQFVELQSNECKQFQLSENKRLEDERKSAIAKALAEENARQAQIAELTPFDPIPEPTVDVSAVLAMPTKLVTSSGGGLRKKPIDIRVIDVEAAVALLANDPKYHGFLTLDTKALKAKAQQIGVDKFNEQFGKVVEAFQDSTISSR